MELQVNILKDPAELTKTQPFQIDNLLWGTKSIPGTSGISDSFRAMVFT